MNKAPSGLNRKQINLIGEATTGNPALSMGELSHDDILGLVSKLGMYQTELETQNEELRQTRQKLEDARDRYANLYDFAPVGYCTLDPQGRIREVNLTLCDMLGQSRKKLVAQPLAAFIQDESLQAYDRHLRTALTSVEKRTCEVAISGGENLRYFQLDSQTTLDDEMKPQCQTVVIDITDRRQAEASLQLSERRYLSIIEDQTELICRYTPDGRLSFVNGAYARYFGQERQELLGRNYLPAIPGPDLAMVAERLKTITPESPVIEFEHRVNMPDGSIRWQSWIHRGLFSPQADLVEYQAVGRDITKRKRAEELRDQVERIIECDLRAPACNAISVARMLQEGANITEEQRDLLGLFEQSGQTMLDTLNSTLDLYKIEIGQYQFKPEVFDCVAIVRQQAELLAKRTQFDSIHLNILVDGHHFQQDSCCFCLGDHKLLRIALQNLLINALEASTPGSTVVVELSSDQNPCVEIRNKGVVPAEIRDRFFDKYMTKGKARGTGIGTYSAKVMVNAQGGDITMRTSDENNETVVTVSLPGSAFSKNGCPLEETLSTV